MSVRTKAKPATVESTELLPVQVANVGMRGRPAETSAGVVALGSLLAINLGVNDPDQIACMVAALGAVPSTVSLFVDAGGLRGVLRKLYRGRS